MFKLEGNRLLIDHHKDFGKKPDFTSELESVLKEDGECVLLVDKRELSKWQVARMALEDFFFPEYH